jgi:hypothetical protein
VAPNLDPRSLAVCQQVLRVPGRQATWRLKVQVRLDAINEPNRLQWDRPNTDLTSSAFGVVTQPMEHAALDSDSEQVYVLMALTLWRL